MKKLFFLCLLLVGCAASQPPFNATPEPYEAGFTLPTGLQIPFQEISWCHGIICQIGTDCAVNEVYTSCEMRLLLTEEYLTALTQKETLYIGRDPYYLITSTDGNRRFLGLLFREKDQWTAMRFPGERPLPVTAQRLHIKGRAVVYLMYTRENNLYFYLDQKIFREELWDNHVKQKDLEVFEK